MDTHNITYKYNYNHLKLNVFKQTLWNKGVFIQITFTPRKEKLWSLCLNSIEQLILVSGKNDKDTELRIFEMASF